MRSLLVLAWCAAVPPLGARPVAAPDTLDLATVRARAEAHDPRTVQPGLLERATALRIDAIRASRLPHLAFSGQATIQSGVPTLPIMLPDGTTPGPPQEQVRAQVEADWALFDGGRTSRRVEVEEARLEEAAARVAVTLYALREAATEAYFGALLFQSRAETLALTVRDLEARLALLRARAAEGAALSADADALEADLIRVRQQAAEAEADRRAALGVLSALLDLDVSAETLTVPDIGVPSAFMPEADDLPDRMGDEGRPEFRRLEATEARAEAEARLARAATQPTVSLFGQAGVGRPSPLDFLSDEAQEYALAGVRVRWAPFDWGRSRREAEAARVQAEIARTEADALARALLRETEDEMAHIERLRAALPQDERAVALREEALRVATLQLDEGVLLPDAYTDRVTDLAEARLTLARHRIELARAQARLLSTLGFFPESPRPQDR